MSIILPYSTFIYIPIEFTHNAGNFFVKDSKSLVNGNSVILTFDHKDSSSSEPLRLAVTATGVSKTHVEDVPTGNNRTAPRWPFVPLNNLALEGLDTTEACGEDALLFSHISTNNNTDYFAKDAQELPLKDVANVFAVNGLPLPVSKMTDKTTAALFGIADGVGGMAEYEGNNTALMSHELMRHCSEALNSTDSTAKEVFQRGWDNLLKSDAINIGSTTANLVRIAPSAKSNDKLSVTFANVGDSVCVIFRPVLKSLLPQNKVNGAVNGYIPLAMSWPTYHHTNNSMNLPPCQLTILTKNNEFKNYPKKTSMIDDSILYSRDFANHMSDLPWIAQEGFTDVQRGDLVLVFSDGIADNLRVENYSYLVHLMYENILNTLNDPASIPFLVQGLHYAKDTIALPKGVAKEYEIDMPKMEKDIESIIAGNVTSLLATALVRFSQSSWKIDDMSVVVGLVH